MPVARKGTAAALATAVAALAATAGDPPRQALHRAHAAEKAAAEAGAADAFTERTVENLYYACLSDDGGQPSWCEAYLLGVADMMAVLGRGGSKVGICGADYRPRDLRELFERWVLEHREFWKFEMLLGPHLAFREAWPCN